MARRKKTLKKLRKGLSRVNGRKLLLYLLFLFLACIFWFVRALQDNYTADIKIRVLPPVVPADISLSEPFPKYIEVRLSDEGNTILWNYVLSRSDQVIHLPVSFSKDRYGRISIGAEQLENLLMERSLSPSSRIERIYPSYIDIAYNPMSNRQVPIRLGTHIIPTVGSVLDSVVLAYKSAKIYGSKELIDSIPAVWTDTVTYKNIQDSAQLTVKLISEEGVTITPQEINVRVFTEKLIQKELRIPLSIGNDSLRYNVRTFPSIIKVNCYLPASRLDELSASDLVLSVDLDEIQMKNNGKVSVIVLDKPKYVEMIETDPSKVDYILEEKSN